MTDFVFATHSGLYFARVGEDRKLLHSEMIEDGYHYGITTRFDAESNATLMSAYRGGPDVHTQNELECRTYRISDTSIESIGKSQLDEVAGHVHQFATGPGGTIFIANTKRNSVDYWHPEKGLLSRLVFDGHDSDVNHVNSIFMADNVLAVMLHNLRKMESQVAICRFNGNQDDSGSQLEELGRISLPDVQCHNVGVIGKQMYYNASGSCGIVSLDLGSLRVSHRLKMTEHTKGMCSDGKKIFAGMSNYANRNERAHSSAWVVTIDPQTMQVESTVQFTEASRNEKVGNINEIRVVGQEDVFDTGSMCNPDLLLSAVDIQQNQLAINLRRSWIRTIDPIKKTIKKLVYRH